MFFIYILFNKEINKYYVGHTVNIENRLADHNKKGHKTKFSRKQNGKWVLMYKESFPTRSAAVVRERYIKSMKSRKYIESLIISRAIPTKSG
jgi:putative endonuclease